MDKNPNFAHMWKIWRIVGMFPTEKYQWLYIAYGILLNLFTSVISPALIFLNVFNLQSLVLIVRNLQSSFLIFASTVKVFIIVPKLPSLRKAERILQRLNKRTELNKQESNYMRGIVKQCRIIVLSIEISFFMSFCLYGYPSLLKRQLIFQGWLTSDKIQTNLQYTLAMMYQIIPVAFQTLQNVANDTYMLVSLNLLRAQFRVLGMRLARIGNDRNKTPEECYSELKCCVNDHQDITRVLDIIKPVVSQTVLTQLVATGVILCLTMFYYMTLDRGVEQLINTVFNTVCLVFVTFPVCYFGTALMTETDDLTTSIYSCNWIDMPLKFRKSIIIFMERSQLKNIIYAGGIVTINLETFIAIIRLSFSMFTFLDQVSKEVIMIPINRNETQNLK